MATSLARNAIVRGALLRSRSLASKRNNFSTPGLNRLLGPLERRSWFSSYPSHEVVGMPSLSPTMESGSIVSWTVGEGESFGAGDVLCSVETDKATVDFEAQDEGIVAKIILAAGPDDINCGTPIMVTVEDEDSIAAFKDFVPEAGGGGGDAPEVAAAPAPEIPAPAAPVPAAAPALAAPAATGERVVASPRAHTLAKEMGFGEISALRIVGTGPDGRIIAQDVLEYVPSPQAEEPVAAVAVAAAATAVPATTAPPSEPVRGAGFTDYSLPVGASEMAARLTASKKNVPHYYLTVDLTLDALVKLRSELNSTLKIDKDDSGGISVNDLLLKAAAAAMKAVPSANASWMDSFVRVYDSVDVNVVVGNGASLYAPVIRDVGRRGLKAISDDFAAAAAVAESDEAPTGAEGFGDVGTFTVVNLGMFGVKSCSPIIREPQACALALGVIENRVVPNDDEDSEQIYKQSVMMTATLSCDHRVVDGAVGAQWLAAFKSHVQNPLTLLL